MKEISIKKYNKLSKKEQEMYSPTFKQKKCMVEDACDECGCVSKYPSKKNYGKPISYHEITMFEIMIADIGQAAHRNLREILLKSVEIDTKDIKLL
jgi:hypothetical protein